MAQRYLSQSLPGGIDFSRVNYSPSASNNGASFPVGMVAFDHNGQAYIYTRFENPITAIAEHVNAFSLPVNLDRTFADPAIGDCDGILIDCLGDYAQVAEDRVDGFLERKVAGNTLQFGNFTPSTERPVHAWVKVRGVAIKAPADGNLFDANLAFTNILASNLLTIFTNESAANGEFSFGRTLEGSSSNVANILFDALR